MGLAHLSFCTCVAIFLLSICSLPSFALSRDTKNVKPKHEPLGFLQNLVGCEKGDAVEGLRELKQYLHKFGYLQSYSPSLDNTARDDSFDDLLESAIRTYQLNYNLNVTGKLDDRTVEQMIKPRCGVPDIINGTTSMNSGKAHHSQSAGVHVVMHYNVNQGGHKWLKTQLTYAFLNSGNSLRSVAARAFSKWSAVTKFSFQEIQDPDSADIKIGFFAGNHGDDDPFDGPGGILAHSYYPTIGWFHLDKEERWSTNPSMDEIDLESVTVHEMGHLLGLAHSSDENAVMYPTIAPGVVKRELQQDDIDGISDLYDL
ncbi:metalloendoproteinase 5-MMP-like [Aristolochia californica]|uniref:metalloendoproteinase 5-MMP-like n=1 Tax=Aristolochia californica TaxID=171875 RepID=UPI0035D85F11